MSIGWRTAQIASLTALAWAAIAILFVVLGFDALYDTDSRAYLSASQHLDSFPPLELPGYPALVAFLRGFLAQTSPKIVMQGISLVAYVLSAVGVYLIFAHHNTTLAFPGAMLFALFPLEGVTLSVFPRVNSLIYFTVAWGLLLYVKGYNWAAVAMMAFSLFTHKSVWPLVLIVGISAVLDRRLKWWSLFLISMPLALYWIAGAFHHNDPIWLLDTSIAVKFKSRSEVNIPVFAGLAGTFKSGFEGDTADLLKAIIVIASFTLAAFLLYSRIWADRKWLLGVILPVLLWPVILNQGEVWSSITYTHLIVLPLVFWLDRSRLTWVRSRRVWFTVLMMCALSQVVWAIYIVHYFSS